MKKPAARPITAARIEAALEVLACFMVDCGDEGRIYLPLYQRL